MEGEEKETMRLLSLNKNNSEIYLSKTHGLKSFFLVQTWCAACSPRSPHSLIAQRLLYWAHFTTEEKNHWMFENLIDKDFFPLNFKMHSAVLPCSLRQCHWPFYKLLYTLKSETLYTVKIKLFGQVLTAVILKQCFGSDQKYDFISFWVSTRSHMTVR